MMLAAISAEALVGDNGNFLFRLHAQANVDRVARAGCQFWVKGKSVEVNWI